MSLASTCGTGARTFGSQGWWASAAGDRQQARHDKWDQSGRETHSVTLPKMCLLLGSHQGFLLNGLSSSEQRKADSCKKLSSITQPRSLRTQHHRAVISSANLPPGDTRKKSIPQGRVLAPPLQDFSTGEKDPCMAGAGPGPEGLDSTPTRSSHEGSCSLTPVIYLLWLSPKNATPALPCSPSAPKFFLLFASHPEPGHGGDPGNSSA